MVTKDDGPSASRSSSACAEALSARLLRSDMLVRQPMECRENRSITNAKSRKSRRVDTYAKSTPHGQFGAGAVKSRWINLGGRSACVWGIVSHTRRPRLHVGGTKGAHRGRLRDL